MANNTTTALQSKGVEKATTVVRPPIFSDDEVALAIEILERAHEKAVQKYYEAENESND